MKKSSPVKEVKTPIADVLIAPQKPIKKNTVNKSQTVISNKQSHKQKPISTKVVKEKKPDDYDDGNWLTVKSSKTDKKKKIEDVSSTDKTNLEKTSEKTTTNANQKNSKQLKDIANKVKKEEAAAAASSVSIVQVENKVQVEEKPIITVPFAPVPTTPTKGFEYIVAAVVDKKTAEIIEKIEEAIIDVADTPVILEQNKFTPVAKLKAHIDDDVTEKNDEIKAVETNVAFDELGGM